jgi:predicted aldo/keto reductase-like oxidoreductase
MRYKLLGTGSHWFPGAKAAHIDELDLEQTLAASPLKDQIPDWLREAHAMLHEEPEQPGQRQ